MWQIHQALVPLDFSHIQAHELAEYVPDFVKLAEAYGAQGIRVTKAEELEAAFTKADAFKKGPTLIECIVPTELNVLPMVPAGKSLSDMLLKDKK